MSESAPNDQPQATHFRVPSWLVPAVLAALSGVGIGATGHQLASDQQPAVLAQAVDLLRTDVAALRVEQRATQTAMSELVRELAAVRAGTVDRFTQADHAAWTREVFESRLGKLEDRVGELEKHH